MAKQLVKNVFMHSTVFVPGLGELKASLPDVSKTIKGLEMSEGPNGIICKNLVQSFVIPYATVKAYTLGALVEDEEKKPEPLKVVAPKAEPKKSA